MRSAPYPTSEKIRIYNSIRVISITLHIQQKIMDMNVVKVLFDLTRSTFIRSQTRSKFPVNRFSSKDNHGRRLNSQGTVNWRTAQVPTCAEDKTGKKFRLREPQPTVMTHDDPQRG
jgi:hypothetical protein